MLIDLTNGSIAFRVVYFWEEERLVKGYPDGILPEPQNADTGSMGFVWSGINTDVNTAAPPGQLEAGLA